MLRTIIKKEIHNNIFSFRFLTGFIILLVIVTVTVFILTNDYLKRIDEYSERQAEIENYMKNYAHFNRVRNILRVTQPPIPFHCLIRGLSSGINIQEFDDDPLPVMFPLIDLTFIVTILMSLIALIFSYDSICGEKEDGTLKLMLANGHSRAKIMLGKIGGGILTLLLPFVLSLIVGLLVMFLHPRVLWKGTDWAALALILAGSILYVSLFYCLGIFISSRHHFSSSSIMTCLFVWVLIILVIPSLSPYVASFIKSIPSTIKISRESYRIQEIERDEIGRKMQREKMQELVKKYPVLAERLPEAELKLKLAQNPAYKEAYEARAREIQGVWDEANRLQAEKARALWSEWNRKRDAQTELSRFISMLSPLSDFTYLATDLSSTGVRNSIHFGRVTDLFWQNFDDYEAKRLEELREKDPLVDWWNTPVDMSDRPRMQYIEQALAARMKWVMPVFAVLVITIFIFFSAAYFSFIKYDVR